MLIDGDVEVCAIAMRALIWGTLFYLGGDVWTYGVGMWVITCLFGRIFETLASLEVQSLEPRPVRHSKDSRLGCRPMRAEALREDDAGPLGRRSA